MIRKGEPENLRVRMVEINKLSLIILAGMIVGLMLLTGCSADEGGVIIQNLVYSFLRKTSQEPAELPVCITKDVCPGQIKQDCS